MKSLWKAEGTFWFDLFRLACHGLMLAIFLGFLGSVLPVGDSLAVFRIEFTVILAMCGIVAYLLGRSLIPLLVLITVFLSLFSLMPFVGQSDVNDPDLRLHQHNVLYGNPRMEELAVNIGKTRADVLMLQEVSEENFAILRKHLEATYPHFNVCLYSRGGVAVMMRETGALLDRGCLPKSRVAWMRVETVHGPVTVASIHQLWPWPKGQFWQIDRIARDIAALPEPVVIAGDFNNVPWSAAVRAVTRAANGKLAKGLARSFAFPTPWPQFRIDHVVVPRGAKVDARLTSGWGSDHLGVTADIAF